MILRDSLELVSKAKRKNDRSKAALRCASGKDKAKKAEAPKAAKETRADEGQDGS